MTFALLGASIILLMLAAHPYGSYPLSLALLARLRPRPVRQGWRSGNLPATAALCVCAYNEASVIRAKVANMLAMRRSFPGLELLVYVDAASDATAEILQDYAGEIQVVVSPVRHGKTYGMNLLVARTSAECIIFSDANVIFAAEAVPALLAPFADPEVGLTCGHLVYPSKTDNPTARSGSLYWRLEEHIKRLESATGSVMGADGSIFAVRRNLHRPPPPDLIDDMFVSFMVLCQGHRLVRAGNAVAYEESVSQRHEEFRRKVRIACQAFNVHRALWPELRRLDLVNRYKYVSHKLLRWWTIYLLAGSAAAFFAALTWAHAWLLLGAFTALTAAVSALLCLASRGPLAALGSILEAFMATGVGCYRSLRGERFQTWSPPESARAMSRVPSYERKSDGRQVDHVETAPG